MRSLNKKNPAGGGVEILERGISRGGVQFMIAVYGCPSSLSVVLA